MSTLPVPLPAGAGPDTLSFGEMLRRAQVLAKTELVPTALQGKPEAIVVVGVWGAEHGVPLMTAIQEVHVIENRPSPSAQLRLALIRRAGHEVRWVESSSTVATVKGRRREYRNDRDGWVVATYTIDDARKAELLDEWVEAWFTPPGGDRKKKHTWKIGDDTGRRDLTDAPDWVKAEMKAGRIRSKDNWRKYPVDMLRARAAAALSRMEFSDVMAALAVGPFTPEELGVDVGQDIDEPADPGGQDPSEEDGDADGEVIEDAVVVEDLAPGPEARSSAVAQPPAPDEAPPSPIPMPDVRNGDRAELAAVKRRIRAGLTEAGWAKLVPWLTAAGIHPTLDRLAMPRIDALNAELDKRGVAPS